MAVSFVAKGALAANATTTTLNIVAPTLAVDDIMIAVILGKDNQVITPPDANWTKIVESNNTTGQRITIAWKRAVAGDSGATFAFTKPTDNNTLFCGVISAWRGCVAAGSPIDATAPSIDPAATAADIVDYATFDPTETTAFVVAAAVYNNDLTTPGNVSGTNPTFSLNVDLETLTGTDGSIFESSGGSNGAATGARTQASNASATAINIGVLFGLIAAGAQTFSSTVAETLQFADLITKTVATLRSNSETGSFGDFTSLTQGWQRLNNDLVTFLDTTTKTGSFTRSPDDTPVLGDVNTRTGSFIRSTNDNPIFNDFTLANKGTLSMISDTLQFIDDLQRTLSTSRTNLEALIPADTSSRILSATRLNDDTLQFVDDSQRSAAFLRTIDVEIFTVSDTVTIIIYSSGGTTKRFRYGTQKPFTLRNRDIRTG